MARISKAPDGGKFRARAAASLDGTEGAWGNGELLNVLVDANGELVAAAADDVEGVIWTPESRRETATALDNFRQAIGGKVYTVFTWAEIQEMDAGDDPTLGAGDKVYGAAAGAAALAGVGATYLGTVFLDDTVPGGAGLRMVLNINALPVSAA